MICNNCGAHFDDDLPKCPYCGDFHYAGAQKEFMDKLTTVSELAIGDACTGSNPRIPTQEEMEKLLKACFYGEDVDF